MPNVLPQGQTSTPESTPKKHRVSFLAVVLTMILAVVIILLGERIMFDLNRAANPLVKDNVVYNNYDYTSGYMGGGMSAGLVMEKSSLSGARVYYYGSQSGQYKLYKILIHAAFVLPIFLLFFLVYYWVNIRNRGSYLKVVVWGYMVGAIWFLLHLIGETAGYVIDQYKNSAVYIILVFIAVVLTSLAVFLQKKSNINNEN